ncbi:hypothetical protein PPACK8108_LOCUS7557 [Phakopsora pachyrhizi]|uniref:SWIM-type domain-containing protein n=1 Tax=Phakopsora pachyrhizi TaxID=170000 RepID=A0AAV0AUZ4_PHAPC|nr:hypothetical protein PPACK8108_LOCUS7557 [Phakopsora pachyrhizi]
MVVVDLDDAEVKLEMISEVIVYIRYPIQQSGQDLQKFLLWIILKQVVPPGSGSILIQRNTMFLIHLFHQQLSGSSVVFQRSSCIDSKALVLNIVTVIDRENLDICSCKLCTDLVNPMCNHARCNTHKILSFRGLLARLVPETGDGRMMRDLLIQKGNPGGNRLSRNGCGNGQDRSTRFSQDVILSDDGACGCEQTGWSLL